ncbi:MAG: redoxin [Flammeovirgaceae bacterium]|nr:redoxin [Flammeovirgaceae bacterium]|tara:strand:+ start:7401 stop:8066 length:666 start_codon:yes stop_codon:yes gene_type:complete
MNAQTQAPSYQEDLKTLRENLKQMLPDESLNGFDNYAKELDQSMKDILKIKVGDTATDFTLSDQNGDPVSLSKLLQNQQIVLVFYRGAWCPYCNLQLAQLQSVLNLIEEVNGTLLAISPQTPDTSISMVEKNNLKFQVLSDVGNSVANKYTTVFRHADEATAILTGLGIDFTGHYTDDSGEIPVPAVFVIGQDGKVKFAQSEGADFRNRVETSDILNALNK